jgi:hypothetical protein
VTDRKKAEEIAFNRRYSRFKVQIYFKNRQPITHYGQERYGCTVAQIRFKHVTRIVLDREKGLQDCEDRILLCDKIYNGYTVALIYDRKKETRLPDGTLQTGREIRKYIAGQLAESEEIIFPKNELRITVDVVHKNNNGVETWDLVPTESTRAIENINFKTEVENALNKKPTPDTNH